MFEQKNKMPLFGGKKSVRRKTKVELEARRLVKIISKIFTERQ